MKQFFKGMYQKKNFKIRLILVILAVIMMGFSLSWLVLVDFGTDPCTCMNMAIASRLGLSFGTWQALFNIFFFIFVFLFGREHIGFGTFTNMFLVGYSCDFFSWIWSMLLPANLFQSMLLRCIVLVIAITLFVFAAAVYMDVKLGSSPYDALPFMIAERQHKLSFRAIRILYDFTVIFIGFCLGGNVGIVTILMGFSLGPVITFVGNRISRLVKTD